MKRKANALNEKALLAKNPKAAKVFAENRAKLGGRRPEQKPYGLGLPYGKTALASAVWEDEFRIDP